MATAGARTGIRRGSKEVAGPEESGKGGKTSPTGQNSPQASTCVPYESLWTEPVTQSSLNTEVTDRRGQPDSGEQRFGAIYRYEPVVRRRSEWQGGVVFGLLL